MRKVRDRTKGMCFALALPLISGAALAQHAPPSTVMEARVASHEAVAPTAPAATTQKPPSPDRLKVSFKAGQLSIEASDSTLTEVLEQVASLTGVRFEIPTGARNKRLPIIKLGPGHPRQVLALLFDGSNLDYLIQDSSTDPDQIVHVLLVPHTKKARNLHPQSSVAARSRGVYSWPAATYRRADSPPAATESPVPAQSNYGQAGGTPLESAPGQQVVSNDPTQQSLTSPPAPSNRSGLTTEGTMNPPATMNHQSINQQLQQMYQQRTQMMQQLNQQRTNSVTANPGTH